MISRSVKGGSGYLNLLVLERGVANVDVTNVHSLFHTVRIPQSNNAPTSQQSNTTGNASAGFVNSILEIHNRERAEAHPGAPPLVWNNTLAADAKTWAEYLGAGKIRVPEY